VYRLLNVFVFAIVLLLFGCNPSKHYFHKRVGLGWRNSEPVISKETKPSDTSEITKKATAHTKKIAKPKEIPDSARVAVKPPIKKQDPFIVIEGDTVKLGPVNQDEIFNFKAVRKKYRQHKMHPALHIALLLIMLVLLSAGVIGMGIIIYRTAWKLAVQNLVFLAFLLVGAALTSLFMAIWNSAVY
jgi:hypothetical protein